MLRDPIIDFGSLTLHMGKIPTDVLNLKSYSGDLQAAINDAPDSAIIWVPFGNWNVPAPCDPGDKELVIMGGGKGSVLSTSAGNSILKKTTHGPRLSVQGICFQGNGIGIEAAMATSGTMYHEFDIAGCIFSGTGTGIKLVGAREPNIDRCYFDAATGIYVQATVNPHVVNSLFKNCATGIWYDGDNTPYSAGLQVIGCTMLGVTEAVKVGYCDDLLIANNMIDYCDKPVQIFGQDGVMITGNYLTSRNGNPVIAIAPGATYPNTQSQQIKIVNNRKITTHDADTHQVSAITLNNVTKVQIAGNTIDFWSLYGIDYTAASILTINNNVISAMTGYGANAVHVNGADDSTNRIYGNEVSHDLAVTQARADTNRGATYKQSNRGTAVIPAGQTYVLVNHGVASTPQMISLTPSAAVKCWVPSVNNTQMNISIDQAQGTNTTVYWAAYGNYYDLP